MSAKCRLGVISTMRSEPNRSAGFGGSGPVGMTPARHPVDLDDFLQRHLSNEQIGQAGIARHLEAPLQRRAPQVGSISSIFWPLWAKTTARLAVVISCPHPRRHW